MSTVNARYHALRLRARLLEGRACKALQANCKAAQGSVRLCEAVLKVIIRAYGNIRLWELLQCEQFEHVTLDILHGLTYEILGIRPLLIDELNNDSITRSRSFVRIAAALLRAGYAPY